MRTTTPSPRTIGARDAVVSGQRRAQASQKSADVDRPADALRGLLIGTPSNLPLDAAVPVVAFAISLFVASRLLDRLARCQPLPH